MREGEGVGTVSPCTYPTPYHAPGTYPPSPSPCPRHTPTPQTHTLPSPCPKMRKIFQSRSGWCSLLIMCSCTRGTYTPGGALFLLLAAISVTGQTHCNQCGGMRGKHQLAS